MKIAFARPQYSLSTAAAHPRRSGHPSATLLRKINAVSRCRRTANTPMQAHWTSLLVSPEVGVYTVRRQRARDNARFRARRARQSLWCTRKMWHSARWFGCPDRSAQLMRPVRDAWVPSGVLRRRSSCDMTRGWLVLNLLMLGSSPEPNISLDNLSSLSQGPVLKSEYFKECKVVCSTSIVGVTHGVTTCSDWYAYL